MKLPESKQEWENIKERFIDLGVEDTPMAWTFILSQLQNTKMPELDFEYDHVFAHYKRWKIAVVLQTEKLPYLEELKKIAAEKMVDLAMEAEADGASSSTPINESELEHSY